MKAVAQIATYRRLRQEPLWKLLASEHGPIILGLFHKHLLEDARSLPASAFVERIARDLDEVVSQGVLMPQTAQAYIADWLSAGFLERHFPQGAVEEEYELSAAAEAAIRFVSSLVNRRSTATESRLAVVMQQLMRLAEETDSNPQSRVARLVAERERIDEQIAEIQSGKLRTLDDAKALERTREIIQLSDGLVGDFRRVRDEFEHLNGELRAQILGEHESRGEVLEALFSGVDVISDSPAGKSFTAFWQLLTNPEQTATFDEAVEQVLARTFSQRLSKDEQKFLRRLTSILLRHGGVVHETQKHFARSLNHFVQSRGYLEHKRLSRLLGEAQQLAVQAKDVVKRRDFIFELNLTSCRFSSLSQMKLLDPSANKMDGSVRSGEEASVDLSIVSQLISQSEIDFEKLKEHIRDVLADQPEASIGDILVRFPAEQGLASVVGYVALGSKFGVNIEFEEHISWTTDEIEKAATIPAIFFLRERIHELV